MDFLETPAFPGCPNYGYTSEPMYSTVVTQSSNGRERRIRLWDRPLCRFNFNIVEMEAVIQDILEYFHSIGGRDCGFRFKDSADYLSCKTGETPAANDQPIIPVTVGSDSFFQLFKEYKAGTRSQLRKISKPVATTIKIANAAGVEQVSSKWDLDETTGIVVPNGTFVGVPTFWGGEFDVPVRFDSDSLPIVIEARKVESASFSLTELRL